MTKPPARPDQPDHASEPDRDPGRLPEQGREHPTRTEQGSAIWVDRPVLSASDRPLGRLVARPLREFLRVEAAGSILLLVAAVVALLWANSWWSESYRDLWHTPIGLDVGSWRIEHTLQHWVNDALMVIFFLVVGLEIKYEIVNGDLRDPRTAALPIVAAFGGMLVPAGIYLLIAGGPGTGHGWGIPMATDIAFAVGVLGVLGRGIPSAARLFLLTLAIVDDIGAIMVIAFFYTTDIELAWLAVAVLGLVVMLVMRRLRIWVTWSYVVVGVVVWFALLESGVHATLAGVAIGLLAPAKPLLKDDVSRDFAQQALHDNELDPDELHRLRFLLGESVSVVERLQAKLHPISAYVVLPVFALANAGVNLGGGVFGEAITSKVGLGVIAGLVIGKPVGIWLASFVAVKLRIARMPEHTGWLHLLGLGAVAGIGFTVSLFIAGLSFDEAMLTDDAKVGILLASLLSAVIGVVLLKLATARSAAVAENEPAGTA